MPLFHFSSFFQSKVHVSYNDELSGNSSDEHDPYLARMKAEGEEASSEDGKFPKY